MGTVFKSPGKGLLGFVSNAVSNSSCRLEVEFTRPDRETPVETIHLKAQGKHPVEELPLFSDASGCRVCGQGRSAIGIHSISKSETSCGVVTHTDLAPKDQVKLSALQGKLDHQGIRVQLIGVIELAHAGVKNQEFLSLSRELSAAGEVRGESTYAFDFSNVDMSMDSYRGNTVRLRYVLRVTVSRGMGGLSDEFPLWVCNPCKEVPPQEQIKLEVGIEECLHLEFTYNSSVYGVDDCVLGSVHFKLVKINLKTMELEVRRKEITSSGKAPPDLQTLYKYEIMDGAPVRGELLPVRLYLGPLMLSPSYEDVLNKFSVKYMLNLVLVDSEDRRYFKQHEITLVRKPAETEAGDAGHTEE